MNIASAALRRLSVIAVGAALAAVVAGVASAAIPSANGTINACYDKQSGQARIVDPATNLPKNCSQKEAAVSWSVQGPAGPVGPAGPAGASGFTNRVEVFADTPMNSLNDKTYWAMCPTGKNVIGGGAEVQGQESAGGVLVIHGVGLVQNNPMGNAGWAARAEEFVPTDDDWKIRIYAICANVN